jgi:hypothetical protein
VGSTIAVTVISASAAFIPVPFPALRPREAFVGFGFSMTVMMIPFDEVH